MTALRPSALIAVAIALAAGSGLAVAETPCETYGKLALQQQKDNEAAKCGLTGQEWSTDLKGHVDWCLQVGPDKWKQQLQQRTASLTACKSKK
jgi:hypothetical protein